MAKITKENIVGLSNFIDKLIVLNGIWEALDGIAARMLLNVVNDKFVSKIPNEYDEALNSCIAAIVGGQYEDAVPFLSDVLAGSVQTPLVDGTEAEKELYKGLLSSLYSVVKSKMV